MSPVSAGAKLEGLHLALPSRRPVSAPAERHPLDAGTGAGLIAALPADACGIAETARLVRYLAAESAGQCGPCLFGLAAIFGDW